MKHYLYLIVPLVLNLTACNNTKSPLKEDPFAILKACEIMSKSKDKNVNIKKLLFPEKKKKALADELSLKDNPLMNALNLIKKGRLADKKRIEMFGYFLGSLSLDDPWMRNHVTSIWAHASEIPDVIQKGITDGYPYKIFHEFSIFGNKPNVMNPKLSDDKLKEKINTQILDLFSKNYLRYIQFLYLLDEPDGNAKKMPEFDNDYSQVRTYLDNVSILVRGTRLQRNSNFGPYLEQHEEGAPDKVYEFIVAYYIAKKQQLTLTAPSPGVSVVVDGQTYLTPAFREDLPLILQKANLYEFLKAYPPYTTKLRDLLKKNEEVIADQPSYDLINRLDNGTREKDFKTFWTQLHIPPTAVLFTANSAYIGFSFPEQVDILGLDPYSHLDFSFPSMIMDRRAPGIDDFMCTMMLSMNSFQKMMIAPQAWVGRLAPATEELAFKDVNFNSNRLAGVNITESDYNEMLAHLPDSFVRLLKTEKLAYGKKYLAEQISEKNFSSREGNLRRRMRRWTCYTASSHVPCRDYNEKPDYTPPSGTGQYTRNKFELNYPIVAFVPFIWSWPENMSPRDDTFWTVFGYLDPALPTVGGIKKENTIPPESRDPTATYKMLRNTYKCIGRKIRSEIDYRNNKWIEGLDFKKYVNSADSQPEQALNYLEYSTNPGLNQSTSKNLLNVSNSSILGEYPTRSATPNSNVKGTDDLCTESNLGSLATQSGDELDDKVSYGK